MNTTWYDVFPEINWIGSDELKKQVIIVSDDALEIGGWRLEDLDNIPFTLIIPNTIISYRTHISAVTRTVNSAYLEFERAYNGKYNINYDYLIAGALLHDIGKLIEYEKNSRGENVKSHLGKNLRHPFSGAGLAIKHKLPYEIAHIIANHAHEGDGTLRSPECVMINKADMMHFEALKSFNGMI